MAGKFKAAKQLYAQDKDIVRFLALHKHVQVYIAHAGTETYEHCTYDLVKIESG